MYNLVQAISDRLNIPVVTLGSSDRCFRIISHHLRWFERTPKTNWHFHHALDQACANICGANGGTQDQRTTPKL